MNNPPFARLPLLVDSLASDTGNNMYIVKKGKILDQVNIGELNIGYPDYLCYTSEFGVIDVLLRGTGRGTNIMPKNPGFSCGPMPVEPDFREQETISNDVVTSAQGNNPIINDIIYTNPSAPSTSTLRDGFTSNTQPEIQRVIESRAERTRRVTDISRTIDCDGDRATVEIRIKPQYQMTGFRYIESIPKACLPELERDFKDSLLQIGDELTVQVVEDPLIMWRFNSITREQRIEYELDACLRECEELIQGMAFAEGIDENTGQPVEADSGHEEELHEGDIVDYVPADVVVLHSRIEDTIITQAQAAAIQRDAVSGSYPNTVIGQYKALQEAVEAYSGSVRIEIKNTVDPLNEIDEIVVHFRGVGIESGRVSGTSQVTSFMSEPGRLFGANRRDLRRGTPEQILELDVLDRLKSFLESFATTSPNVPFDINLERQSIEEGE